MAPIVDLYRALSELVDQIPEGMVSTPRHLAVALGDPVALRAVVESMKREEFRNALGKVVDAPRPGASIFSDFESDELLKRLAESQMDMSRKIIMNDDFNKADRFAGVDAVYYNDEAYAACVVLDSDLRVLESASTRDQVRFPYIPGYLMFREAQAVETAARLVSGFDVLFVNGHGVAHPRGCGLASCVGLELDVPSVGVARRLLVGNVRKDQNWWSPIMYQEKVVGAELRLGGAPVYVSAGHRISLEMSIELVKELTIQGKLPEPLRRAHLEARASGGKRR